VQTPKIVKKPSDELFYNLVVENACGPNSINEVAEAFITGTPGNPIVQAFVKEKRAIVATVTINFLESAKPKSATVPLVALTTDDTSSNKIDCNEVILRGVPRNQPISIKTDFRWTIDYSAGNAAELITKLGTAVAAVSYLGPHTAAAGMSVLTFAKGIDAVSKATLDFLKIFDPANSETIVPKQYRLDSKYSKIAYGKTLIIAKTPITTNVPFSPEQPLTIPLGIEQVYGETKALLITFGKQPIAEAFVAASQSATSQNLVTLCNRVVAEVNSAYGGDPGAVALAVYYYIYDKQELFKPFKATCLSTPQVQLLQRLGFRKPPYEGALDPNLASKSTEVGGGGPVSDAAFTETKELLTNFARQLKNLPSRLNSSDPTERTRAVDDLASLFDESVAVAGESVGLLPRVDLGIPRAEVVEKIKEWGQVSRFGCYVKPKSTLALERKITGETLILFPDRRLMAHVQVGKTRDKLTIVRLEMSKADADIVIRLMEGRKLCGVGDERWDPKKDLDTVTGA
jgi:hypothetical protein